MKGKMGMNLEREIVDAGRAFGNEAAEHIDRRAEAYSEHERQRIELANQPRINELYIEGNYLAKRERQLEERLARATPACERLGRKRRAWYYWTVGIILAAAGFFFALLSFEPYRLGWKGILCSAGIALVTPFAVEEFLDAWKSENVLKLVVTGVFGAALVGGGMLAAIRGDLMAAQVTAPAQDVVIDGKAAPQAQQPENSFYQSTGHLLRLLMLFLAVAIDLGSGIAMHRARVLGDISGDDPVKLLRELEEVHERLGAVVFEITALTNAPGAFVARFWRDFYRALLTQTARRALSKIIGFSLVLFFLSGCGAPAEVQEKAYVIAAIDLSASEAVKGRDLESAFGKNVNGVARLLGSVAPATQVTVIGITENSFALPYVLLSAQVSDDKGYFGERLSGARRELVRIWRNRASKLQPNSRGTDIMGALLVAAGMFESVPQNQKKFLYVFSDMRHATRELDLERPRVIPVEAIFTAVERGRLFANLHGVTVYVLGADADGQTAAAWDNLRQLWVEYFKKAGATLAGYSELSEPASPIRRGQ